MILKLRIQSMLRCLRKHNQQGKVSRFMWIQPPCAVSHLATPKSVTLTSTRFKS